MVAIVDYGAGNVTSVAKTLRFCGADAQVTNRPEDVLVASKIVLPGVGHFSSTQRLQESGLRDAILARAAKEVPFLGICVGMQWMFGGSSEAPDVPGAGWLPGRCERFPADAKCPHVGWNRLQLQGESPLLEGLPQGTFVYFTHSYFVPSTPAASALTNYQGLFPAAINQGNLYGVQFHPEKSGDAGLHILRNFLRL